jgi:hypothetical protein
MGNRHLVWGLVVLLLGMQLRTVESYLLTPKASQFVESKLNGDSFLSIDDPYSYRPSRSYDSLLMTSGPISQKRITPPRWLGWALISVGAVLVLNGITSRR